MLNQYNNAIKRNLLTPNNFVSALMIKQKLVTFPKQFTNFFKKKLIKKYYSISYLTVFFQVQM